MKLIFQKKLTKNEIENRTVHLTKDIAKLFPRGSVTITIGGVELEKN